MDFDPIARPDRAFQEPIRDTQVVEMCRRVLGDSVQVASAVELGWGSYNSTFGVELVGGSPVVLRVAPRPERQLLSERHWLRSEYIAAAWLTGLGPLVPRVLGADFTHQVLGRDYMVQSLVGGVPAPERLPTYSRDQWPGFFAQLGAITRSVHDVKGEAWGPLAAPIDGSWSDALHRSLAERATDLANLSARYQDVVSLAAVVDRSRYRLDVIDQPRLLHGDLWTANILLDPLAAKPTVVGVLDSERAWWGDPLADWALYRAATRPIASESDAFWLAYGGRTTSPEPEWRRTIYRGWHLAAERVEAARHEKRDVVDRTITELGGVLATLG